MTHIHHSEKNWTAMTAPIAARPVHFMSALHG